MNNKVSEFLHFGLSVSVKGETLPELPELPECFEYLEIAGDALGFPAEELAEWFNARHFEELNFRNLIPADLTRQVNCESGVIVQEFKAKLRALCAAAGNFHAQSVGLDPDWESLYLEHGRRDTFAEILRAVSGDLEYYNMELDMAVRIPGSGIATPDKALELIDQLPAHRLKLALDINPHELISRPPDWHKVLTPFRFDVHTVRLAYESDLGNKLLYRHIESIVQALMEWQREIAVYFAPSGKADIQSLADVIREACGEAHAPQEQMLF